MRRFQGLQRWLYLFMVSLALSPCAGGQDDHGNDRTTATPLTLNAFASGQLHADLETEEDWFSIVLEASREYAMMLREGEWYVMLEVYDEEGETPLRAQHSGRKEFIPDHSGTYYLRVGSWYLWSPVFSYELGVFAFSDTLHELRGMLRDGRTHDAYLSVQSQLEGSPNDPELNLYAAYLHLADFLATPDARLTALMESYGVALEVFPEFVGSAPERVPLRAGSVAEVQEYAMSDVLPAIEVSLGHLHTARQHKTSFVRVVNGLDNVKGWFEIDSGDIDVLIASLTMAKAMIYAVNAFSLDVDATDLQIALEAETSDDLNTLLTQSPGLGRGAEDVAHNLRRALEIWLEASLQMRTGIEFTLAEDDFQEDDLFSIDEVDGDWTMNYLMLMDRVLEGLVSVTGGDFNGDGRVNSGDLFMLQQLWQRPLFEE